MKSSLYRAAAALAAGLAAIAAAGDALPEGYTCCNFHYDGDWISDANWGQLPMIPAGTPIKVKEFGWNNRAYAQIDGKPFRLGHDYGRAQESIQQWVGRLVVKSNPRAKIDRWPDKIRKAALAGKIVPGMTREQAIVAAGYPPTHRTPTLESSPWHLWFSRAGRYEVHFDDKGRVARIVGQN